MRHFPAFPIFNEKNAPPFSVSHKMENVSARHAIVIATYNEAGNLPALVPAVFHYAPDAILYIVDDNSPDGSPALLAEMQTSFPNLRPIIRQKKDGYGGAVLEGFRHAVADGARFVATLDADFSHDPKELPQIFEALKTHDVAIGSRYNNGVRVLNWQPSRLLLSLFANRYVKFILKLPADDATSGFRGYRRDALQSLLDANIKSVGYSFLVEILTRLHRQKKSIIEIPIIYTERREGQSKMSGSVIFEAVLRPWILRFTKK